MDEASFIWGGGLGGALPCEALTLAFGGGTIAPLGPSSPLEHPLMPM